VIARRRNQHHKNRTHGRQQSGGAGVIERRCDTAPTTSGGRYASQELGAGAESRDVFTRLALRHMAKPPIAAPDRLGPARLAATALRGLVRRGAAARRAVDAHATPPQPGTP